MEKDEHVDLGVFDGIQGTEPHRSTIVPVVLAGGLFRNTPDCVRSFFLTKPLRLCIPLA